MSSYAIKLDDNLHIIEVVKKVSPGLAHQQALRFTDAGFRARVIDAEDDAEMDYLYNQLLEKRQMGFIEEFGHVPNGTRSNGDGARTIGNMIFPAFGGKLEGVRNQERSDNLISPAPLTLPKDVCPECGGVWLQVALMHEQDCSLLKTDPDWNTFSSKDSEKPTKKWEVFTSIKLWLAFQIFV